MAFGVVGRGGEAGVTEGGTEVEVGGTEEEGSRAMALASCILAGAGIWAPGWGGGGAMPLLPGGGPGGGGGKSSSIPRHSRKRLRGLEGGD